jgi:hypothetical protein
MTETKSGPEIRDFDALSPKKRKARIGGREVEVGPIPARVTLEMARLADETQADEKGAGQEDRIKQTIGVIVRILDRDNTGITADWLLENTTLDSLLSFMQFVLEPASARLAEVEGEEKSPEATDSAGSS